VQSKHMKSLAEALGKTVRQYECVSVGEGRSLKLAEAERAAYIEMNRRRFTRVYPSGSRMDSSNFHPQPHWNAGSQLVALNWQTSSSYELRFNKGRFRENGNCGYLLKPEFMRTTQAVPEEKVRYLRIEILSAYSLPKPEGEAKGEIIDPYVWVFLEGNGEEETKHRTVTIDDNGFHPIYRGTAGSTFTVCVKCWSLAVLVIQVWDSDLDADDFLAEAFIPLGMLRTGVRAVPLWDIVSRNILGGMVMCRIHEVSGRSPSAE
jgi:phosphatidylinositol phospholipase C delta